MTVQEYWPVNTVFVLFYGPVRSGRGWLLWPKDDLSQNKIKPSIHDHDIYNLELVKRGGNKSSRQTWQHRLQKKYRFAVSLKAIQTYYYLIIIMHYQSDWRRHFLHSPYHKHVNRSYLRTLGKLYQLLHPVISDSLIKLNSFSDSYKIYPWFTFLLTSQRQVSNKPYTSTQIRYEIILFRVNFWSDSCQTKD